MLEWIATNWQTIVGTVGTVVLGASIAVHAVAKITPNTKDDKVANWLDKVYAVLKKVALNKDGK